ncbi:MAG: small multidrug resistance protein [Firmicutes bacterium]|nr:small multidrug resistance protein [Bacillota bacterium]
MLRPYVWLFGALLANAFANFSIKLAVRGKEFKPTWPDLLAFLHDVCRDVSFWLGVFLFVTALAGYTAALAKFKLSTAYPIMTGGGFLVVFLLSALYLKEKIGPVEWLGAALIVTGIWLLIESQ